MQGLNHWFGEGDARWQAIHDMSFEVQRGSLTVLSGPSGCGKTTLLTLVGCLRSVQDGSVRLLGRELRDAGAAVQQAMRRRLGVIFQAHNLHDSLTALQNVLVGLQVHGRGGDAGAQEAAAAHLLNILGLGERVSYLPARLSGGEKQRVAIARALVSNPEVVLADEPTAALDRDSSLLVVRMLKALGRERGVSTLMITHDDRIHRLADKVLLLRDGRMVEGSK
jgi:putative ABC transport system ATP-binding protein